MLRAVAFLIVRCLPEQRDRPVLVDQVAAPVGRRGRALLDESDDLRRGKRRIEREQLGGEIDDATFRKAWRSAAPAARAHWLPRLISSPASVRPGISMPAA